MSKTFTEEQVKSLIRSNLGMKKEIEKLKDQLSTEKDLLAKETHKREEAEKKYAVLCERCISMYVTETFIPIDNITVKVEVPRFMGREDFETGLVQTFINRLTTKREEQIFRFRR